MFNEAYIYSRQYDVVLCASKDNIGGRPLYTFYLAFSNEILCQNIDERSIIEPLLKVNLSDIKYKEYKEDEYYAKDFLKAAKLLLSKDKEKIKDMTNLIMKSISKDGKVVEAIEKVISVVKQVVSKMDSNEKNVRFNFLRFF